MSTSIFQEACETYKLLLDKGYPESASLKLVGDRHRLSRVQRNCLFRGVAAEAPADRRRAKLVRAAAVRGRELALDWYNVLITVESYLRGAVLFLSDDGVIRDASATHGSYRTGSVTTRAMDDTVREVAGLRPSRVQAFLDRPIAFSARMANQVRDRLALLPCPTSVSLEPSADFPLKSFAGVVASSDSVVLDACTQAIDLAQVVLEERFGFIPPAVRELFSESRG